MSNKKISELVEALTLTDTDLVPVVEGGATKKMTRANLRSNILEGAVGDVNVLSSIEKFDTTTAGFSEQASGVNGKTFRLTHSAGQSESAEITIPVTEKFRGKQLYLSVDINSTATSGNLKAVVTDETNVTTLLDSQIPRNETSITEKRQLSFQTVNSTTSIKVKFEALQEAGSPTSDIGDVIVELALSERVEIVALEQEENVFSAGIVNNGTATLASESYNFIQSVSRTGIGTVDVVFIPGFFTTAPSVTATAVVLNHNIVTVDNITTSGFSAEINDSSGTKQDRNFNIVVQRQGTDYKNLERRIEREVSSFNEILVEEADSNIRINDFAMAQASTNTSLAYFTSPNITVNRGDAIEYINSSTDGMSIVAKKDGVYHVHLNWNATSTSGIGFSLNTTAPSTNWNLIPASEQLAVSYEPGGNATGVVSWSGYLDSGDVLNIHVDNTIPANSPPYGIFNVAFQGSLKKANTVPDSKVEIPTSEVRFVGSSSTGSSPEDRTVSFDSMERLSGDAFSVDNSNGTIITMLKDGVLSAGYTLRKSGASAFTYLTLNQSNPDSSPLESEILGNGGDGGSSTHSESGSWTGSVKVGDVIRVNANSDPDASENTFSLFFWEKRISVAVSNIEPQFEDVDSMIRVHTSNGYGSTNNSIRRFSSIVTNKGSAITYADSATEGASFTINESGTYHISFDDSFNASSYTGISLNSTELSSNIDLINSPDRLAMARTTADSTVSNAAWSGYLNEGDVVRPHNRGTPTGATTADQATFTIAKQALPSIAEVDVTPFVDLATKKDQYIEFNSVNGSGSTNTSVPFFPSITRNEGDSIIKVISNSAEGTYFEALEDCFVNFNWHMNITTNFNVGWSRNPSTPAGTLGAQGEQSIISQQFNNGGNFTEASSNVRLVKGDKIYPMANSANPVYGAGFNGINLSAQADSKTTYHSIAQTENVFSARIQNNSVATILNESHPFIESSTRASLGVVDVVFKAGFFSEAPSVNATIIGAIDNTDVSESVRNVTVDGFRFITEYNPSGTPVDFDFDFIVQRQGSDYKDLQKAIVSLSEFPRVNNLLKQIIDHNAGGNTLLDRNGQVRFDLSNIISSGDSVLLVEDDVANTRTRFTALKKCTVHASFSCTSDTGDRVFVLVNNVTKHVGTEASSGNYLGGSSSVVLNKDDFLTIGVSNGNVQNAGNAAVLSVVAEATELERVDNVDAAENVLSANLFLGAGSQSIESTNIDFIDSIVRNAVGNYTVNYKLGFFTVPPAVTLTGYHNGGVISAGTISYIAHNASSMSFYVNNTQGVDYDPEETVAFTAVKQGVDYKNLKDVVVAIPDIKYQTKRLTAGNISVLGTTAIPSLAFNNLEIGKTYRVNTHVQGVLLNGADRDVRFYVDNGGTEYAGIQVSADNSGNAVPFELGAEEIFVATATSLTTYTLMAGTGAGTIYGTAGTTWVTLEEISAQQTSQWT